MSHRRRAIALAVLALVTTPAPAIAQTPSPDPAPSTPAPDPAPARPTTKDRNPVRPVSNAPRTWTTGTATARAAPGAGSVPAASDRSPRQDRPRRDAATSGNRTARSRSATGRSSSPTGRSRSATGRSTTPRAARCADLPPCRAASPTLLGSGAAAIASSTATDAPRVRNAIAGAFLLAVALAGSLTLRHARRTA